METFARMQHAAESSSGIDLVIEELDEFTCGRAALSLTNADYVTYSPASVALG